MTIINHKTAKLLLTAVFAVLCTVPAFSITEHDEEERLFAPPVIKDGSVLDIYECAAAAFNNSPKIRRAKYNLDIAKSGEGIAKSVYFPVLSAGAGYYSEHNTAAAYNDTHYRELPNAVIAVNQLIYNFGKSSALIKTEEFNRIAAEYEFMDSICEALFEIKEKYYSLLKSEALLKSAEKSVLKINEYFAEISSGAPDKLTAETNLKEAEIKLIEARNNYENARIDLANAMYLDKDYKFTIKKTPSFSYNSGFDFDKSYQDMQNFTPVRFNFSRDEAVMLAYKNSPDLRILTAVKKAMENSLKYAKRTYLPDLTGSISYEYGNLKSNLEKRASNNGLRIGVNLSSDANIKEIYHGIKSASAELKAADNEIDMFKQDLFFEVKRAFNNIYRDENRIKTSRAQTELAFKTLKTVSEKYRQNKVSYTALQDAGKDFIKAEEKYIDALYSYNLAVIQAEEAMHIHAADIHHKSEHALRHHAEELLEHLNKALSCSENEASKNRHKDLEEDL